MLALEAGAARVVIDPAGGGRFEHLAVGGLDLLVTSDVHEAGHGAFPMAPFAGRIRHGLLTFEGEEHQLPLNAPPHAIHGTARDQRWAVERKTSTGAVWSTNLADPWPFGGRVVQRASLEPGSLSLEMEVHAADRPMPASCGWHPWWSRQLGRGDPVELELRAGRMYRRDAQGIPTGELVEVTPPPWDDCFTDLHEPVARLRWPGAAMLAIETDCSCVVVFTEPEHAVCVEPQSGPPDEVNFAPHVVVPGTPLVIRTRWSWSLDEPR